MNHFFIICFGFSGTVLGPFWVLFGAKVGHDAPRWTQEGPQEPQSTEKQHLQKVLFFPEQYFSSLGGSQDEHEAQDGSQEALEKLQDSNIQSSKK